MISRSRISHHRRTFTHNSGKRKLPDITLGRRHVQNTVHISPYNHTVVVLFFFSRSNFRSGACCFVKVPTLYTVLIWRSDLGSRHLNEHFFALRARDVSDTVANVWWPVVRNHRSGRNPRAQPDFS